MVWAGTAPRNCVKVTNSSTPILLRPTSTSAARPASENRSQGGSSSVGRVGAELSGTGRMVSETRETARAEGRYGGIRPDVVAGIKKEMAEGRFGGSADVERAIDALLMEL
jgi:hypothetical protein